MYFSEFYYSSIVHTQYTTRTAQSHRLAREFSPTESPDSALGRIESFSSCCVGVGGVGIPKTEHDARERPQPATYRTRSHFVLQFRVPL